MSDLCSISRVRYSVFSEYLHGEARRYRSPVEGGLEITRRCNLFCQHCYVCQDPRKSEMSTQEIYSILDTIAAHGCLWLLITGGEPLLREDFYDIYLYAKRKGFLITLFTNGTLLTQKRVNFFKKYPPCSIEISLYGATKATYEQITGVKGSFQRCLEGIYRLKKQKLSMQLKTLALNSNKHELKKIEMFAKKLGLRFRVGYNIEPRLNGDKGPFKQRISEEDIVKFIFEDKRRLKAWIDYVKRCGNAAKNENFLYSCGGGISSFFINAYGEMGLCLSGPVSGNLRNESFGHIWYEKIKQLRETRLASSHRCQGCVFYALCELCPARAYRETGDQQGFVEYLCKVTHLQVKSFGLEKQFM